MAYQTSWVIKYQNHRIYLTHCLDVAGHKMINSLKRDTELLSIFNGRIKLNKTHPILPFCCQRKPHFVKIDLDNIFLSKILLLVNKHPSTSYRNIQKGVKIPDVIFLYSFPKLCLIMVQTRYMGHRERIKYTKDIS